jgi:SAM-dependent methyltransferase
VTTDASEPVYDRIGVDYGAQRRTDPRIAGHIRRALGEARRVLNVGAGTGSYELPDREWVAVDPSRVMIEQRGPDAAPVVQGIAETLPFVDDAFDAAIALLSLHHWSDPAQGVRELARVSGRQVILTWDAAYYASNFWLLRDYLPEMAEWERTVATFDAVRELIDPVEVQPVPVPHDCMDGFGGAYWRRPEAYLDPHVRASISGLALLEDGTAARAMQRLEADLRSGAWHERNAAILELDQLDLGFRLLVAER